MHYSMTLILFISLMKLIVRNIKSRKDIVLIVFGPLISSSYYDQPIMETVLCHSFIKHEG